MLTVTAEFAGSNPSKNFYGGRNGFYRGGKNDATHGTANAYEDEGRTERRYGPWLLPPVPPGLPKPMRKELTTTR